MVTGATGAIGPSVVDALAGAGYKVRVLARRQPASNELPREVDVVHGDLQVGSLREATRDVDVVVHMAALLHAPAPSATLLPEYAKVNVEGTRMLLAAARESRVSRFIYFSTVAVYGPSLGRSIDESSEPAPDTPYAVTKLTGEKLVLEATAGGGPEGVVLRLGSVYGPRVKGNYRALVNALSRGWYVPIGRGENRRTLLYEGDAGQAVVLAIESQEAVGRVFNVTDGQYHTMSEIVDCISAGLGRSSPRVFLPVWAAKGVARAADLVIPTIHARFRLEKYLEDLTVDGSRFRRIGFAPQADLRAAWETTIRCMRRCGEL